MAEHPSIIQFKHVFFGYDHLFTLEDISFQIEEGDFVGIIGPNGSGKTTILKLILGIFEPSQGTVDIFGQSPVQSYEKMGYVPQRLHLDPMFPISVSELVLTGTLWRLPWWGRTREADRKIAQQALETVGIAHLKGRQFGTLSSGQAQRALIARALAGKPKLLILDEPTANIDPQSSADIHQILKKLSQEMTVLMVTHDLHTVIHDTNKVLCVHEGVTELAPDKVCEHFAYGLYHTPLIRKGDE